MNWVLPFSEITANDRSRIGGKGYALAQMHREGMRIPEGSLYKHRSLSGVSEIHGMKDWIRMELYRKPFDTMRWEEIWDVSLRIRNMFVKTPLPEVLRERLLLVLESRFEKTPVSVRSSAPGEDSSRTSFAGLHESFVNIRGAESILEHVRLVWASLWSDRALLYRKELKLDPDTSAMAVVVQKMIIGLCSGVVFGRSPVHDKQTVIEAVHGLNQGLVDGTIEPDRWILKRETGQILEHHPARREKYMVAGRQGVALKKLPRALRDHPPIDGHEAYKIYGLAVKAESLFGCPQDVEWTYRRKILHTLQARPITTPASSKDERSWYLSLHRSLENLKNLRVKIEENHIPGMEKAALEMSRLDLADLSDAALAREIRRRREIYEKWRQAYWDDCIPFAHGMRLFGRIYNDLVKPQDPFQFMALLEGGFDGQHPEEPDARGSGGIDWQRPRKQSLHPSGEMGINAIQRILQACDRILDQFSDLVLDKGSPGRDRSRFLKIALQMAELPAKKKRVKGQSAAFLQRRFLARFGPGPTKSMPVSFWIWPGQATGSGTTTTYSLGKLRTSCWPR